ncbi:MAG: NUDIX hydrolase [Candidatus Magasanikbacteria bacterium]|nr:NUDIX hydrolase [Candidatus Magasanikbacteria bacterium]
MSFEMAPIPPAKARGWKVLVDGVEATPSQVSFESKFGRFVYGLRPEGYDSVAFYEVGGGGSVTLPFSYNSKTGELLVGLVPEVRPNMGPGLHLCVVGGFKEPNESHAEAQAREADEEAGIGHLESIKLEGLPYNSNRLMFVADVSQNEGVHAWAIRVPFSWLVSNGDQSYSFAMITGENADRLGKAKNVVFFPWRVATKKTADALAHAAILQLLAMQQENGHIP